jgi:hypothetical protein
MCHQEVFQIKNFQIKQATGINENAFWSDLYAWQEKGRLLVFNGLILWKSLVFMKWEEH